jgi:hypothetical protein
MKVERVLQQTGLFILVVIMSGCALPATLRPAATSTATPSSAPTSTFTPSPTPTATPTPSITPTPDVAYNIYDTSSFPPERKAIAMDPMKATPEQQAAYQQFLNNQRQKFFVEKGIDGVVKQMVESGKIYPEQAGLWGMAYWESMQVEHGVIVLGPGDVDKAKTIFQASYLVIGENYDTWTEIVKINGKFWGYEFGSSSAIPTAVSGILVGVGSMDSSSNRIILVADKDEKTGT